MSELRVPTRALSATVTCSDGRQFQGRLFVPETSMRHDGATRAVEFLNDRTAFFPFQPDEGGAPFVMSKRDLLYLTVSSEADVTSPSDEADVPVVVRKVTVECGSRTVSGLVRIEMPETHSRVLDYVNQPDPFLVVQEGDLHHLVQKKRITRIIEVRED